MISGVQVDAWGAFVPSQGKLIEKLRDGVIAEVEKRGLANLQISSGEMAISDSMFGGLIGEKREYIFFQQKLGSSANTTLALRIAPRGTEDLEISWRLLESNPAKSIALGLSQTTLVYLGGTLAVTGLFLIPFGMGLCVLPFGVWMMGMGLGWWKASSNKSRLTADQMLDARVLAQTVDYCLMKQMEKLGVSATELKILQAAQMEGIGRLGTE
ncbi:MAG: hypothetical protein HS100_04450 [Anaerolineales bacterium]|nr:hypothetical protein [Anaerolineales bacterium]